MAKTYYYILVTQRGNPIITDYKLPIYWNYNVAIDDSLIYGAKVKRIKIDDLKALISDNT